MTDPHATNLLGSGALAVVDRMRAAVAEAAGLDGSGPAALVALHLYAEGEGVDALARALSLSHSGAVRLVDQLVARGLVRRAPSERDRRAVALRLTAAGRRAARRVADARLAALGEALAPLSQADQERLAVLLGRVLAAQTHGHEDARRLCRLCDADACGHPERCPVTLAAHG
ncbi:MAG TPA: MarR family transcriptional regulator [Solirubrobacteraceae bacterium]|nr:MarR family transcriptional regulator [Solirubrobacteraceae bacterium]